MFVFCFSFVLEENQESLKAEPPSPHCYMLGTGLNFFCVFLLAETCVRRKEGRGEGGFFLVMSVESLHAACSWEFGVGWQQRDVALPREWRQQQLRFCFCKRNGRKNA